MEELALRRRQAKTPVFRVGQLEESTSCYDAQLLAERYQALLPPRLMSPFVDLDPSEVQLSRTIRKIKRQESLRSLMKKHSRAASISDCETLVGSPTTPRSPYFEKKVDYDSDNHLSADEFDDCKTAFDNDMALKKCMELLTSELSSALSEQQPLEQNRNSSGLQILLMIESYERVQQHLRQALHEGEKSTVQDVERILEYWLKVLYSVYDRSHELSAKGNEEYFPPPLSVLSTKPPVKNIKRKPLRPGALHVGLMDTRTQRAGISC